MVFYKNKRLGSDTYINKNRFFTNKEKRCIPHKPHYTTKFSKCFFFQIPSNWGYLLYKNSKSQTYNFYMYSPVYFFNVVIPKFNLFLVIDPNVPILQIHSLYSTNFTNAYWLLLKSVFSFLNKPFFFKVKFKGKGYYIFKGKRQTITPQFGHSHRIYLYAYYVSVIFLNKTHIFIFGFQKKDVLSVAYGIKNMKRINIFTGRGVRFSRQIIYKKVGKVSSYR